MCCALCLLLRAFNTPPPPAPPLPQMYHAQLSPLCLCDFCPRSYHLACLGAVQWSDLPPGEWACPKCSEKAALAAARASQAAAKKAEADRKAATASEVPPTCYCRCYCYCRCCCRCRRYGCCCIIELSCLA